MEKRKIGGLTVSTVGLGCNNFGMRIDEAATKNVIDAAIDAGIDFFDTADIYGGTKSEEFMGRVLGARATRSFSRPSSASNSTTSIRAGRSRSTSAKPSRTACAACKPTASTCTNCIAPTTARLSPTRSAR